MSDRDIEDTRMPEDEREFETCVICNEDFDLDVCVTVGARQLKICECCAEEIRDAL